MAGSGLTWLNIFVQMSALTRTNTTAYAKATAMAGRSTAKISSGPLATRRAISCSKGRKTPKLAVTMNAQNTAKSA